MKPANVVSPIIVFLISIFYSNCFSTTYYIDSQNGNDSLSGLKTFEAWKTFDMLQRIMVSPSDSILLKRNCFYRGVITLKWSGEKNKPIVIGAYGTGAAPFIAGSVPVKNWSCLENNRVWQSVVEKEPVWIWIVNNNGSIEWGEKKHNRYELHSQSDWCYEDGYLLFYSDSNPELFKSIEMSSVDYCIGTTRSLHHIRIENLEIAFAEKRGIRTGEGGTDWVIQNNTIHHVGDRIVESGDGITHYGSYSTIKSNIVYECGNHGIYVVSDKTVSQSNIVERNTVFNCYHNCIDLMNRAGIHTSTIVRYNTIYCTQNFTYRNVKSRGSGANGIYTSGKNESRITNCLISNNIIVNCVQMDIHIGKNSDSIFIINNTMYSTRTSVVPRTACLYVNTDGRVLVKNNIGAFGGQWAFRYVNGSGITADYNCWYQPYGLPLGSIGNKTYSDFKTYQKETNFDKNSRFCNPDFKKPSLDIRIADFSLTPHSCCIGAGDTAINVSGFTSLKKSRRAKVDIGVVVKSSRE